jgi:hypothetical protein
MAVVSFVLLWGRGFASIFDVGEGNAWAAQTPNETPPMILSPGRNLGPIGISLRITDERLIISRGEPVITPIHGTTNFKLATHFPNDTGERGVRQNPVAKRAPAAENKSFKFKDGLLTLEASERLLSEILAQVSEAAGVQIVVFDPIDAERISVNVKDKPLEESLRTILKGYSHSVVYNPKRESQGVRIVQQPKRDSRRDMQYAQPSIASRSAENESPLALITETTQGPTESRTADKDKGAAKDTQLASAAAEQPDKKDETRASAAGAAGGGELAQKTETPSPEPSPQASPQLATLSSEGVQSQAPQGGNSNSYVTPNPVERLQKLISMYEQRIASGASDKEYEINMKLSGGGYVVHDRDRIEFWQEALNRHAGR